ncbi:MAG: hypothetical protein GTO44_10060 [Hydrotalea flava]|nr:hypothetical protein [Hydrotalea flava]NIN15397.1 hypothetical protein [Hydrotalea flava]
MSQFAKDEKPSVSLALLKGKPFTIVKIEDSDYEQGDQITKGVMITTQESFDVEKEDGTFKKNQTMFHTTRKALVHTLNDEKLRSEVNGGKPLGPVKCEKTPSKKGGNPYFVLVDA